MPTQRSWRLVEYFGSRKKSASNSASVSGKERMSRLTKADDDLPSFSLSLHSHMEFHFRLPVRFSLDASSLIVPKPVGVGRYQLPVGPITTPASSVSLTTPRPGRWSCSRWA